MKKLRLLFSVSACLVGAWIPMSAHHSFQAEYDDAKPIALKVCGDEGVAR